ncbi:helix-turn-helix transcriptional regulator [Roseimicrobium sp. ORNL1]|nr:helix-turn-helix transcriptional regulator [Roseimicrobium sp. ORNL1]
MSADVLTVIDLGTWLRKLREAAREPLRLTAAALNMDSTHLSKIERNERLPTLPQALALASHFHIEPRDMEARWVAARILSQYGENPALRSALKIISTSLTRPAPQPK